MKKLVLGILTLAILSGFIYTSSQQDTFSQLYNLQGTWKMQTKKGFIFEEWKLVNKDLMKGVGGMIKGSDSIINERVELENKSGEISYTSTVENQNNKQPISFRLTSSNNKTFVFENPEHDYPKRIVYELNNTDSLHAWVDDGIEGSKKRQDFYYRRAE